MSDGAGFAYVRRAEAEALKAMKPSAAKLWIAIRATFREDQPFGCGSRDFADWGIGRDAAAEGFRALVAGGLLRVVTAGSFGVRGRRTVYEIVHRRAVDGAENTVGKSANSKTDTAGKSANSGRKIRQLDENTAGFSDTPRTPFLPSVRREGGREDYGADAPMVDNRTVEPCGERDGLGNERHGARVSPDPEAREAARKATMQQQQRIDRTARTLGISAVAFMARAGGPSRAGELSTSFERGELDREALTTALDGNSGSGPPTVAASERRVLSAAETRALICLAVARGCELAAAGERERVAGAVA